MFNIANCFQNAKEGVENYQYASCVTIAIEWVNYIILGCLVAFLLSLHCLMYMKINKKCSLRVLKRNRVQILTLSLMMIIAMFIKVTFMMNFADLVLLLFAQFLRFLIWSLTLINFIKSGRDLVNV